jgi:hypothetical protein
MKGTKVMKGMRVTDWGHELHGFHESHDRQEKPEVLGVFSEKGLHVNRDIYESHWRIAVGTGRRWLCFEPDQ